MANIFKKNKLKKIATSFFITAPLALLCVMLVEHLKIDYQTMFGIGVSENAIVYSTHNKVIDAKARTTKGNDIWTKADNYSKVNWDYASEQFKIENGGYLQNLSYLHGIEKVIVDMESGSLNLYHGYAEPEDLATPLYDTGYTFLGSATYTFTSTNPTHVRLKATSDSIIRSIKITYSCSGSEIDLNNESGLDGLENAYLKDTQWPYLYATTSYVTGEDDTFGETSKRSLKMTFKNTERNSIELDLSKTGKTYAQDNIISLVDSSLSFKAKFSDNVKDTSMNVTAYSDTSDSGTITMDEVKQSFDTNGWKVFNFNFKDIVFDGNDAVTKIKIEPNGIDASNKDTAYVLLDEIKTETETRASRIKLESWSDSLENLPHDEGGWVSTDHRYSTDVVYGNMSKSSLLVIPRDVSQKHGTYKYWTCFNLEEMSSPFNADYSSGLLRMQYKPINVINPSQVMIIAFADWSNHNNVTVNCQALEDGWYYFEFNLGNLSLPSSNFIRLGFGFDIDESKHNAANIYIDNLEKIDSYVEDYTQGWENMVRDTGWERCIGLSDRTIKANETSINSLRCTFVGKNEVDGNRFGPILSPQNQGIHSSLNFNSGILEAKFLFSSNISDYRIRLTLVDSGWHANRYDFDTTPIGDGWRLLRVDLSNMPAPQTKNESYNANNIIRIGLGSHGINAENKSSAIMWIDDVFYYKPSNPSLLGHSIWEAYNTETIKQTDTTIADRGISSINPLEFNGMRNEVTNTQLMVKAGATISNYNLRMSELHSAQGYRIGPECFDVKVEKYIYVNDTTYEEDRTGWLGTGWYPDALVPLNKIISSGENNITSGNQQGFWINLNISKYAKPGIYEGHSVLTLGSDQYDIPVSVTVSDGVIPDELNCRTYVGLWEEQIENECGEGFTNKHMVRQYYDFMVDYGINPEGVRNEDRLNSPTQFAERFANEIAFNGKINTYRLPTDGTYDNLYAYLKALIDKNKEVWDNGEHVSFFDKIIIYTVDEPDQPDNKDIPKKWAEAKTMLQTFKDVTNDLKNAGYLSMYPTLLDSLLDMRYITPFNCEYKKITGGSYGLWNHYPDLLNETYLDTPCPTFKYLDVTSEREVYQTRFDHLWFYGCMLPTLPYPSYHMDTSLVGQRLIKWMQYRYDIEGELYWCSNYFLKNSEGNPRDVWTDPISWGDIAGDGQLVYPGKRYDVFGPLPSIRLENIRNAIEDFEYFLLIDNRIDDYNEIHGTSYTSSKDILASYYGQMFVGTQLNSTTFKTQQFESIRSILINIINELY